MILPHPLIEKVLLNKTKGKYCVNEKFIFDVINCFEPDYIGLLVNGAHTVRFHTKDLVQKLTFVIMKKSFHDALFAQPF